MSQIDGNAIGRLRGKAAIERVPDQPPSHHFSSNQSVLPTPPASYHTFSISTFSERERAWLANTTYSKTDIEWLNTASSWDVLGCIMYIPPPPLGSVPIQSHRLTKWQGMNWTTLYCFVRLKANWHRMVAWKWSYPCWIRNGQLRELMINWEAT